MSEAEKKQAYTLVKQPTSIPVPGKKTIDEFIGKLNTGTEKFSVARMAAPAGWEEPKQTPEFDEITILISGRMQVEINGEQITIGKNETIVAHKNHTVRYSNPFDEEAVYWSVCIPAFSNETVKRENN